MIAPRRFAVLCALLLGARLVAAQTAPSDVSGRPVLLDIPASANVPLAPPLPTQPQRTSATFVGLGLAGVGALGVGTITYLGRTGTSPWVGLAAVPLAALLDFCLARLLDLPVTPLSAAEGALLGTATAGLGYLLGTLSAQALSMDARSETSLGVIGLVVGGAIGVPVWTLIDPLGFAPSSPSTAGSSGDAPAFRAVADEAR
jgi:hypothetical protein